MFWNIFYWFIAGGAFASLMALQFFGWVPTQHDIMWVAFMALGIAAHSMARQNQ